MKVEKIETTKVECSYKYGDFIVDVYKSTDCFEFWLRHPQYGISQMMFGAYDDDFEHLIEKNIEGSIEMFIEEHAPELDGEY